MSAPLLTAPEVAERLAVKPAWVLAQARERRIPHYRLGRMVRFATADLEAILAVAREEAAPGGDRRVADPTPLREVAPHAGSPAHAPAVPLRGALYPAHRGPKGAA